MRGALILAALCAAPVQAEETRPMHHATGTFEVKITPEAQGAAPAGGMPTGRMGLAKTFSGGLVGTAAGTMLTAGTLKPGSPAYYVAVDQFAGTLDGRRGGFVLLHRGAMTRAGGGELEVVIAKDSGTGALAGITGRFTIEVKDGIHSYDLAYALPGTKER